MNRQVIRSPVARFLGAARKFRIACVCPATESIVDPESTLQVRTALWTQPLSCCQRF
jgi:hypothetical protein